MGKVSGYYAQVTMRSNLTNTHTPYIFHVTFSGTQVRIIIPTVQLKEAETQRGRRVIYPNLHR